VNATVRDSVVEVLDGNETAALGAIVDADGSVLTKASEVPDGARCRLADGRVVAAEVVGVDPAYDLALLRLPASGLRPVTGQPRASPQSARWWLLPVQGRWSRRSLWQYPSGQMSVAGRSLAWMARCLG
jgi:hypothetical protein